ncbi:MAG: hypothetical protein LBU66_06345 [Treponema sp.]|jgi:hypothetical protein|nr:hypothetical protein [Treponema sp.]
MAYVVTFYAYDYDGGSKKQPGHAFVGFTPDRGTERRWGFNPRPGYKYSVGIMLDETGYPHVDGTIQRVFFITRDMFIAASRIKENWANGFRVEDSSYDERNEMGKVMIFRPAFTSKKSYLLGYNDCVSFAYAVAKTLRLNYDSFITSGTLRPKTAVAYIRPPGVGKAEVIDVEALGWVYNRINGWQRYTVRA